jgi:hypothetical protein
MRRCKPPIKQTVGLRRLAMWRRKTAQRPKADCGFLEPEGPLGPEAHTVLLCGVPPFLRLSFIPFPLFFIILYSVPMSGNIRRLSRRGPPQAAPIPNMLLSLNQIIFILNYKNSFIFNLEIHAAAKPPGVASSDPKSKYV